MTTEDKKDEVKLYAGKFKTVEDMEVGYNNAAKVFDENEKLKKQLNEFTTTPPDYMNPADVKHDDARIADIKARAKAAGMTQAQYEKFLRDDIARVNQRNETFEKLKKEVGDDTLNLLQDYVGKHYPKELSETMMRTFIRDKAAREAALKHRDQTLNTTVPGVNKPAAGTYHVTDDDVKKAYAAKEKNKSDMHARQHYLNLLAAQAEQRKAS